MSINRLGERCAPWLKIRLVGEPTMSQITSAVDRIVYDDGVEDKVGTVQRKEFKEKSAVSFACIYCL